MKENKKKQKDKKKIDKWRKIYGKIDKTRPHSGERKMWTG